MKSPRRRTLTGLVTLGLGLALLGAVPSPASAAPEQLRLNALPRGAAPTTPYVADGVLVDGDVSVKLPKGVTRFVGKVGDDYLVQGYPRNGEEEVVVRVTAAGARTTLASSISLSDATLSDDGTSFVASEFRRNPRPQGRTVLRRYDAGTGDVTLRRTVAGYARVLDYDGSRAVVGGFGPVWTSVWDLTSNDVTRLVKRPGYEASLAADRLAWFTKDPYMGGCTVVAELSDPSAELWRSCDEAVDAFSTDGTHMATTFILSDGLGPGRFTLRKTTGRNLGSYDAPYYFGRIWFEDGRHVLADAFGRTKGAVVRCDGAGCERATSIFSHDAP